MRATLFLAPFLDIDSILEIRVVVFLKGPKNTLKTGVFHYLEIYLVFNKNCT
jgi:hypothetical protein